MKMRGTAVGAVLLSLLLLVLSGCGGAGGQKQNEDGPTGAAPQTEKPAPAGGGQAAGEPASGTYAIVEGESKASYEVKEVFLVEALNATAVGTTSAIKGNLVLEKGSFKGSTIVVDVTQLKSDRGMRDNVLKTRGLETAKYTTAEFTITGVEGGPVNLAEGQEASFKLTGTAKIHGVEKPLTWDAKAKVEAGTLRLTGTTGFKMAYFNIEPPNIAGKIRVDEEVKLNVDLVGKK